MTFEPETSFGAYKPILNMMLVLLLTLFVALIAIFAYPKHSVKEIHESEMKAEAEREARIKKEMERVETGKAEETENEDGDTDSGGSDGNGD